MESPKIAVFIDVGNLWSSYKELGKLLDFNKVESFLSKKFGKEIHKIFYYVAYPKEGTREKEIIDGLHRFFTYLQKRLGFEVRKKELKTIYIRKEGEIVRDEKGKPVTEEKGNFDIEITIDSLVNMLHYDTAVFFTGDSDFLPVVNYLKKMGKRVCVFSTKGCVSRELKTGAEYFDLIDCKEIHGTALVHRKEKEIIQK